MECNSTYEYVSNLIKTSNVSSFGQVLELQHLASIGSGNIILTIIDNNSNRFHAEVFFDPITNQISPPKILLVLSPLISTLSPEEIDIPMLSGIPEMDITILNFLDDDSLTKACQVNKYTSELCKREELWQRRIEKLNPELLLLKTPRKSWKDFYILSLKFPRNRDIVIKEGNVKLLQWIYKNHEIGNCNIDEYRVGNCDVFYIFEDIQSAAENGQLEILKFIHKNIFENNEDFAGDFAEDFAEYDENWDYEKLTMSSNSLEILKWLNDNNLISPIDKYLFLGAIKSNRLDIMKWVYGKYQEYSEVIDLNDWNEAIERVMAEDNIDTFKWLVKERLYLLEEEDTQYHAGLAAKNNSNNIIIWFLKRGIILRFGVNDLKTLNWLEQLGAKFDYELANDAAKRNNEEVLKALIQRNIFPNFDGINDAILNDHINILDLLQKFNITITTENINYAAEHDKVNVLDWGARNNIFPNTDGANRAVNFNSMNTLNWMGARKMSPNQIGANYAIKNNNVALVKWMTSLGVYPDQNHINWAARNNRLELIKILGEKGVLPDFVGADLALEFSSFDVLDYLSERGIFPSFGKMTGISRQLYIDYKRNKN